MWANEVRACLGLSPTFMDVNIRASQSTDSILESWKILLSGPTSKWQTEKEENMIKENTVELLLDPKKWRTKLKDNEKSKTISE